MKLSEAIASVSAKLFPTIEGQRRPNYSGIFVEAVSTLLDARKVRYDAATIQKIADAINLSSFQRAAASECAKRYGAMEGGERTAPEPKEKKAKPAKLPVKKSARGTDPITGERAVKAPKKAKPAAPVKKAAKSTPAPKKAEGKPLAAPEERIRVKKSAPKVGKVDPITGEPVAASA